MSIKVSGYNFIRARSIPALIRQVNRFNRNSDVTFRYNFIDGGDGFFYAIYFGKIKTELPKPEKNKSIEINPREIVDA